MWSVAHVSHVDGALPLGAGNNPRGYVMADIGVSWDPVHGTVGVARCPECQAISGVDHVVTCYHADCDEDDYAIHGCGPAQREGYPLTDPCPDCRAGSGVPCAWACSSNWDAPREGVS